MQRVFAHVVVLVVVVCASGCQGPRRREPVLEGFAMLNTPLPTDKGLTDFEVPISFDAAKLGPVKMELREMYTEYMLTSTTAARRKDLRDRMTYKMMSLIQHYHDGTTDDLYEVTTGLETLFDMFGLALNGVGAVSGGVGDKAAYAAGAAGLIGLRNSAAKNAFAEQTKFAIVDQMASLRIAKQAEIETRLREKSDAEYSMQAVITDLQEYYTAGSIKDSVAALARSASAAKVSAEAALKSALGARPALPSVQSVAEDIGRLTAALQQAKDLASRLDAVPVKTGEAAAIAGARERVKAIKKTLDTMTVPTDTSGLLASKQQDYWREKQRLETINLTTDPAGHAAQKSKVDAAENAMKTEEGVLAQLLSNVQGFGAQLQIWRTELDQHAKVMGLLP